MIPPDDGLSYEYFREGVRAIVRDVPSYFVEVVGDLFAAAIIWALFMIIWVLSPILLPLLVVYGGIAQIGRREIEKREQEKFEKVNQSEN